MHLKKKSRGGRRQQVWYEEKEEQKRKMSLVGPNFVSQRTASSGSDLPNAAPDPEALVGALTV